MSARNSDGAVTVVTDIPGTVGPLEVSRTGSARPSDADLIALAIGVEADLEDPGLWFIPDGYRKSLALCLIDAVYSAGAYDTSTANVVARYIAYRAECGGDAYTDSLDDLLSTFEVLGGYHNWAYRIGNQCRATAGTPIKAEAVWQLAERFVAQGVNTTDDLRVAAADGRLADLKTTWCATPGQRTGIAWDYGLMLAGVAGGRVSRLVARYVARALDRSSVDTAYAAELMAALAERQGWDLIAFDHSVWLFESSRQASRAGRR